MTIVPGTRLGAFEITGLLGKGGMGEVYRARDTKLGRDVAIKVLSERFASDAEMLARFGREAQSLARLDHPNVGAIYEVGRAIPVGGSSAVSTADSPKGSNTVETALGPPTNSEVHFLVMQLVEGETLAERIARGPIPVNEAINLFSQIAEGLEAAHDRGIVHRDLKPANIKITRDDRAKVLDFGIAKSIVGDAGFGTVTPTPSQSIDPSAPTRPMSPTPSNLVTGEGALIGTPHYMSPEQARGKPVDRRADIWAFGICLYEALTRARPFDGDTFTDVISSVLRDAPDFSALPSNTPPHVLKLLGRCLEKNPRLRLRDIGEAWYLLNHPENAAQAHGTDRAFLQPRVRFSIQLPPGHRLSTLPNAIRISDDGRTIAMLVHDEAGRRVWIRRIDDLELQPLEGSERAHVFAFSPDGEWIGFGQGKQIRKVHRSGQQAQTIVECSGRPVQLAWVAGDEIFWSEPDSGISRVSVSGGGRAAATRLDPDSKQGHAVVVGTTHDGKWLALIANPGMNASLDVLNRVTGQRHRVLDAAAKAIFTSSGHLVYSNMDKIFAIRCQGDPPRCVGQPVQMLEGLETDPNSSTLAAFALAQNGTLTYVPIRHVRETGALYWVTRDGARTEIKSTSDYYGAPRFSPDGESIALICADSLGRHGIYAYDIRRGVLERLTQDTNLNITPVWHPDGVRLAYSASARQRPVMPMMTLSLDGGAPQQIASSEHSEWPSSYSPDGRYLAFARRRSNSQVEIWIRSEDGTTQAFADSRGRSFCPRFDRSGEYIAYVSDESGRWEIHVKPFNRPGRRIQISTEGGSDPVWAPDGSELFYRNGNTLMAVPIERDGRFRVGQPRKLFDFPFGPGISMYASNFDIHPDGQRFVITESLADVQGATEIVVVTNWFEELTRLLPPDESQ